MSGCELGGLSTKIDNLTETIKDLKKTVEKVGESVVRIDRDGCAFSEHRYIQQQRTVKLGFAIIGVVVPVSTFIIGLLV